MGNFLLASSVVVASCLPKKIAWGRFALEEALLTIRQNEFALAAPVHLLYTISFHGGVSIGDARRHSQLVGPIR